MPLSLSATPPLGLDPQTPLGAWDRLQQMLAAQDGRGIAELATDPDVLALEPSLAGLAVRGLRQAVTPACTPLPPGVTRGVLHAARALPSWPDIEAAGVPPTVADAPAPMTLARLSHGPWQGVLQLFAGGHHPGTRLGVDDGWPRHTYLSAAILLGYEDMVDFLCAASTDPQATDTDGQTALWSACEVNDSDRAHALLGLGAETDVTNTVGDEAALILDAVALSSPIILRHLLEHGAPLAVQDASGITPMAALFTRRSVGSQLPKNLHVVLDLLLQRGAGADEVAEDTPRLINILIGQLAVQPLGSMAVAERLACVHTLGRLADDLDACGPLFKLSWRDLQLEHPELRGAHRVQAPPLVACLMARHLLARKLQQAEAPALSPSELRALSAQDIARWIPIDAHTARAALLQAAEMLLMAGASTSAVDGALGEDSLAWATRLGDDEAAAKLTDASWQQGWTAPEAPPETQEMLGPPHDGWIEDINLSRQAMRHSYGVIERTMESPEQAVAYIASR